MKKYPKIEEMSTNEIAKIVEENYNEDLSNLIRPFKYPGLKEEVTYQYNELEGLCPMTGLPDLYFLTIKYIPKKFVPELKSLKMYLIEYRNMRIPHEALASKIFNDFKKVIKPEKIEITLEVAIRGGIKTTIVIN